MAMLRKVAANPVRDHPFVIKLNRSVSLNEADLTALAELLERKVVVKKTKDIIVEGYEYKALHIVERGFAIRYKLLHNGKRQIVNIVLPGDIIGFPACFYEHAVFWSPLLARWICTTYRWMRLPISVWSERILRRRYFGLPHVKRRYTPSMSLVLDAASRSRGLRTSFWRC